MITTVEKARLTWYVQDHPYRPNAFATFRPTNLSRGESPNPTTQGRRSPFSPLNRSSTLPLTPPSPEARPQDGAFPLFPTSKSKSRSNTPTTPSDSPYPFSGNGGLQPQADSFAISAPISPGRRGGDDVIKRLDAIWPGPFHTNKDRDMRKSGHKRTTTSNSIEDFLRSPASGSFKEHSAKPSATSSYHSRNASIASLAGGPRCNKPAEESNTISRIIGKPSEYAESHSSGPSQDSSQAPQSRPNIGQLGRSQTSPVENAGFHGWGESSSISQRMDSYPQPKTSSHRPKPSVAAAIRPLDEIGSMSSFRPSKSSRGVNPTTKEAQSSHTTEARNDQRLENAPPVPKPTRALDFNIGNPYHISTESTSSNDSLGSDVKTSSSRSSPPLFESPQRAEQGADTSRLDDLLSGFKLDLGNAPVLDPPSSRWEPPPSFSRPMYSKPIEPSAHRASTELSPTATTNPASRDGPPFPQPQVTSPDEYFSPTYPSQQAELHGFSAPSPLPPPQTPLPRPRRTAANKGHCKGCGELIMGKSVSSADGRLTGRYHKACFVCKTCKEPFQTTDFYVMNNHPYCGRHYHQLNDSLCKTCDRGIEGQYLETELKQKFHPHCFTCQVNTSFRTIHSYFPLTSSRRTATSSSGMTTLK